VSRIGRGCNAFRDSVASLINVHRKEGSPRARHATPDDLHPSPRVTVINGGATKMYFWTVIQNPAHVQAAVPGTITELSSPRWSFGVMLGRDDWIATTSCPRDHRWRYHLRMTSTSGHAVDTGGSVACRSSLAPS
jgi:hypothetical protein